MCVCVYVYGCTTHLTVVAGVAAGAPVARKVGRQTNGPLCDIVRPRVGLNAGGGGAGPGGGITGL